MRRGKKKKKKNKKKNIREGEKEKNYIREFNRNKKISCGQQLMVRFLLWITLWFVVALWRIVVVCAVVMRNLWITCYFFV